MRNRRRPHPQTVLLEQRLAAEALRLCEQSKQLRPPKQLGAPTCPECDAEMSWSRSILRAPEKLIVHLFICTPCGLVAETTTPVE
jgi:hypothetical protein